MSDLDRIYNIQKESFRDLYQKYNDIDSPYLETKERLLEKMKHPSSIFYLICLNNGIIGFSRVLFNGKQLEAWLGMTAILPKFQKKGYGHQAIQEIEKQYPEVKCWSLDTILTRRALGSSL